MAEQITVSVDSDVAKLDTVRLLIMCVTSWICLSICGCVMRSESGKSLRDTMHGNQPQRAYGVV